MLTESLLLAGLGGAGGVLLVFVSTPWVPPALPTLRDIAARRLALAVDIGPDWRVLLFSLGVLLVSAVLAGFVPALAVSRTSVDGLLRVARSSGSWRGRQRIVVFQIALCTLLVTAAGLLVRTFEQLQRLDAGFDRDRVVTFTGRPFSIGLHRRAGTCAAFRTDRDASAKSRVSFPSLLRREVSCGAAESE
jgi:hypothetical protein